MRTDREATIAKVSFTAHIDRHNLYEESDEYFHRVYPCRIKVPFAAPSHKKHLIINKIST